MLVALVAITIGTILGYIWYAHRVGPIPSLGEILRGPYCSLPPEQRFGSSDGECRLLATTPFEMFILRMKVGSLAGLVFSSPIWLGEIWGYITPGLKKNERRWTFGVVSAASALFLLGAVLAYFVLALGLQFLLTIGSDAQIAALNGEKYFQFVIGLLLVFGVSFEVPLLTVLANAMGILSYKTLKEKRRFIIVGLFFFAAVITPGQDPYSMIVLAIGLTLAMEIAIQITRVNDKRRDRRAYTWLDVSDDASTPIDRPTSIDSPSGSVQHAGYEAKVESGPLGASPIARPSGIGSPEATAPGRAAAAPASRSGARPIQEPQGRRDGLDLRGDSTAPAHPPADSGGSGGPSSTGSANGYFDDVL